MLSLFTHASIEKRQKVILKRMSTPVVDDYLSVS